MERRQFIKTTCTACIGSFFASQLLQSCGTTKHVSGEIKGSELLIPKKSFEVEKNGEIQYKKYLIVQNPTLQYPICVYRFNEQKYSALWMRCTHQGAELQVFGDKLQCPAHGAEFSNTGQVEGEPATENLKTFPVTVEDNFIKLSLK